MKRKSVTLVAILLLLGMGFHAASLKAEHRSAKKRYYGGDYYGNRYYDRGRSTGERLALIGGTRE